jgi:hypothetical protein
MLFANQYQIAYVAHDILAGADILRSRFGVEGFRQLGDVAVIENTVMTPGGEATVAMKAAVAFVPGLMIELLEPVAGATRMFEEMMKPGEALSLHHIALRCDDIDGVRELHAAAGHPWTMEGRFRTARFLYIDARASLGHFLEYVSAPPEYWDR